MKALSDLAGKIRKHYVALYVSSLTDFQAMYSPSAPEVLFELQLECAYPFRLYRVDMASNVNGDSKLQEVNPQSHLSFDPLTVTAFPSMEVTLYPIAWNGVDFNVNVILPSASLEDWALRWLDVDDTHELDINGLQGVIHSVTEPKVKGSHTAFSVDFGSASEIAFEELLGVVAAAGATNVEVRSSCMD